MLRKFKLSLLLLFQGIILCGFLATPAFAAIKCYTISSGNTTVYSNTGLSNKLGAIYGSDEITVNTVTDRYCKVTYPISRGTKTGYIPTSAILTKTLGSSISAKAKVTTYRRPNGSSYGYISVGDSVKVLGTYGNYRQVKYPVSGGYKYAFITSSDYNKIAGSSTSSGTTYYVTTTAGLILRSSPSTSSSKITTMPYGSSLTVYSISGGWAQCSYSGKSGYCSSSYISTSKPGGSSGGGSGSYSALSQALYKSSSARISCGFDGYTTTQGRHEGIDMVLYEKAPIYALVSGTVVNVTQGFNGRTSDGKGTSLIAIYDSSANKTVIYLHSNPGVRVGQTVSKGQQIGTQGWRGVTYQSSTHTHVEVRNGKQSYAAYSSNSILENPNPTSYWNSKGYSIK